MKLRLLTTKKCSRSCPGCCNKDWNLDALKPIDLDSLWQAGYDEYDEVMFTGGEPLLFPVELNAVMSEFWEMLDAKFYLYTADPYGLLIDWNKLTQWLDGVTLTLHDAKDIFEFGLLNQFLLIAHERGRLKDLSLRLNSFVKRDLLSNEDLKLWDVRHEMKWIENCPLPEDEVFMRLEVPIDLWSSHYDE